MGRIWHLLKWVLPVAVLVTSSHLYYLNTLAATEHYPEDDFLAQATNKSALIIVAHDDDMVGGAGTMTKLTRAGWHIRELCFYQQWGFRSEKDSLKNPVRKRDLQTVAGIQGLEGVDPIDLNFRRDLLVEKPWMPMPYADLERSYDMDTLRSIIGRYIELHRPSVIFTLDDSVGGYGHPDHVVVSRLVLEYCAQHALDADLPVKRVYQMVFPPSLAESVLGEHETYIAAKKVYGRPGMPLPDVQVDVTPFASEKKEAMTAYTTEQNSLRKIWPYYHWYPAGIYFRIFDRDFYRVIDVSRPGS
ncbi:MAG: PIG-L family deacetylase [Flavobacteriales bacterium]|nr:PIG-L family deacetylase [Flavobacteriales bacterium]